MPGENYNLPLCKQKTCFFQKVDKQIVTVNSAENVNDFFVQYIF